MKLQDHVTILLSTYNGENFLRAQLDSLLAQTYKDLHVIIRDDGSSDATYSIIEEYVSKYPKNMVNIRDGLGNLGVLKSFSALLSHAQDRYIMFCDQDDVWLPNKVEVLLALLKKMESRYGREAPILVHSDLCVVDSDLNVLGRSFWRYQNINPKACTINRLLVQNVVTGCATMINKALKEKAFPMPDGAIMHDWWLGLVAAQFGHIGYVKEPTVLYRQHGKNDVGAKRWGLDYVLAKALQFWDSRELQKVMSKTYVQAARFAQRYAKDLTPQEYSLVTSYAQMAVCSPLSKRIATLRYSFFKQGWIRNIALVLRQ